MDRVKDANQNQI